MELGSGGRVAVVTGAGNGIGRGIALELGRRGFAVVVNDIGTSLRGEGRDDGPAAAVVAEIVAAGGRAVASTDSVADADGAARIVETAVAQFGRIDAVVNNAGILRDRMAHKMSADDFDAVLRVHLYGSFNVSRAALPRMREQGYGRLVHMTSGAGLVGNIGQVNYSAAKLGIAGMSRSIALECRDLDICSNCISPVAWSRMVASIPVRNAQEQALADQRRTIMAPEKIAPLAAYLCSEAAAGVSGQVFGVRGNEILLYSQPRPVRTAHRADGWSAETIAAQLMPNLKHAMTPLLTTVEVHVGEPM